MRTAFLVVKVLGLNTVGWKPMDGSLVLVPSPVFPVDDVVRRGRARRFARRTMADVVTVLLAIIRFLMSPRFLGRIGLPRNKFSWLPTGIVRNITNFRPVITVGQNHRDPRQNDDADDGHPANPPVERDCHDQTHDAKSHLQGVSLHAMVDAFAMGRLGTGDGVDVLRLIVSVGLFSMIAR